MEESIAAFDLIQDALEKKFTQVQVKAMNPLALAYIGDGIYSDRIRKYLIGIGHQNVNIMTKTSVSYVRASAQAIVVHALIPELTEDELRIVKRGRNTFSHVPKNADAGDYGYATGYEALLGYLYLCQELKRLDALIIKSIHIINQLEQ
ncbi:Mini-ribonuclease 3 [Acetobacterium bakii]|uniref:Mini-ribonuclease 3 n=1 Tax=Acetobacterium bakii TaxID=52689 RepID=UPI0006803EF4|nr:ribonuclease III domain-containing protein [Acetobacterium bakii]